MKILAIETSCDETAVSILEATGDTTSATFQVLGNALLSQIDIHKEYGGVFPALAKREHAKNLTPLLAAALEEAELLREDTQTISTETHTMLVETLAREPGLFDALYAFILETERPDIDAIAVTSGPGLEPALWVGVNFAQALSRVWNIPLIPVNHMEGHLLSALAEGTDEKNFSIRDISFPVLALLISGGHTELVQTDDFQTYTLLGQTKDDAVGEAFDKVARMMNLPYPGGPEISRLAERARIADTTDSSLSLPRPMLHSNDCDFSFSGLKTAVLYHIKKQETLSEAEKESIALEFENAVGEVLLAKTLRAVEETNAKTVVLGGGVSANTHIRRVFSEELPKKYGDVALKLPAPAFTTDNAIMIGIAGFYRFLLGKTATEIKANGNLALGA